VGHAHVLPSAAFFDAAGNRVEAFEGWPGFIGRHL
jgi:hypothetical protein